jgi:cytoskeletal protein CcmA (bactofilin family)
MWEWVARPLSTARTRWEPPQAFSTSCHGLRMGGAGNIVENGSLTVSGQVIVRGLLTAQDNFAVAGNASVKGSVGGAMLFISGVQLCHPSLRH